MRPAPSQPQPAPTPAPAPASAHVPSPAEPREQDKKSPFSKLKLSKGPKEENEPKEPKESNENGHAGLVGLAVFIILGALLISPLLPGKIFQSFPLSSQSFSTGDQSLSCISTQGQITNNTTYNSKSGAPVTYSFSTSTTESATCNGSMQTAVTGHSSQFNPLGLAIDVLVAVVIAIIFAKVWGFIFRRKAAKR